VTYAELQQKCIYECRLVNGLIEQPAQSGGGAPETANVEIINNP